MSGVVPAAELAALFTTDGVHVFETTAVAEHVHALHPDEVVGTDRMAERRKIEFAAGRACARAALDVLGVPDPVTRLEGGAPLWPAGTTGSISHTRGYCIAAAARRDGSTVGIDVEHVARVHTGIERRILTAGEQDTAASLPEPERRTFVATLFAAKEAFYKAHHQLDPRYLGFDVISISVADNGDLHFRSASGDVPTELVQGTTGKRAIIDGRVIAAVTIHSPLGAPTQSVQIVSTP